VVGGLGAIALAGLVALYFTGALDSTLYKVGLNYTACATKTASVVYCGNALTAYDRRAEQRVRREAAARSLNGVPLNGRRLKRSNKRPPSNTSNKRASFVLNDSAGYCTNTCKLAQENKAESWN